MNNYDKSKHKSDIFADMAVYVKELLNEPELTQKAIKDRNIIIKSLKCEIEHRKIAFKEIEDRYSDIINQNLQNINEIKLLKIENERLKNENNSISQVLRNKNKIIDDYILEEQISKTQKEKTISYKLEKLSEKIPGWAGKIILKILSNPSAQKYLILSLFFLLFLASITGWSVIAKALYPIVTLFK